MAISPLARWLKATSLGMIPCFGGSPHRPSRLTVRPRRWLSARLRSTLRLSMAIDEATASSSSTPSTEGLQDHIESLLQRLPDTISLKQKSPPSSVAGASKCISPRIRRTVCTDTVGPAPAGYKTQNLGRLYNGGQDRRFYNLCRIVLAAMSVHAPHPRHVARADPDTIGPPIITPPAAAAAG